MSENNERLLCHSDWGVRNLGKTFLGPLMEGFSQDPELREIHI